MLHGHVKAYHSCPECCAATATILFEAINRRCSTAAGGRWAILDAAAAAAAAIVAVVDWSTLFSPCPSLLLRDVWRQRRAAAAGPLRNDVRERCTGTGLGCCFLLGCWCVK